MCIYLCVCIHNINIGYILYITYTYNDQYRANFQKRFLYQNKNRGCLLKPCFRVMCIYIIMLLYKEASGNESCAQSLICCCVLTVASSALLCGSQRAIILFISFTWPAVCMSLLTNSWLIGHILQIMLRIMVHLQYPPFSSCKSRRGHL